VRTRPTILFFSPEACPVPALVRQWAQANAFPLVVFDQPAEVEAIVLRGHPCLLFVDGNRAPAEGVDLVRRLKLDAFTAIVLVTVLSADHHQEQVQAWFGAGAD
jgi:DNA-binding response OmpR family regulator